MKDRVQSFTDNLLVLVGEIKRMDKGSLSMLTG